MLIVDELVCRWCLLAWDGPRVRARIIRRRSTVDVLVVAVTVSAFSILASVGVRAAFQVAPLSRASVRKWRYDGDRDCHGGLQQVDHLLVGQGSDWVLADFDQPGALAEAGLPGVTKVLDLGD